MMTIGIDPGLQGGIAINIDGDIKEVFSMPITKIGPRNTVSVVALSHLLLNAKEWAEATDEALEIFIESAMKHSPGTNALTSAWFGFGRIMACIEIHNLSHEIITHPRTWQKEFWAKPSGVVIDTKAASIRAARSIWPEQSWLPTIRSKKPSDGLTDAALISEYGRRKHEL